MPSAGEIVKRVRTVFTTDTRGAVLGTRRLSRHLTVLAARARMVDRSLRSMTRLISSPILLAGGGLGAAGLVGHIVNVGREAQSTETAIANMLQQMSAGGRGPFQAFGQAADAARRLRRETERIAVQSPATAREIQSSFRDVAFLGSRAGLNLREIVNLSRTAAVADRGNPVKGTAARDIRQLLSGTFSRAEIQTPALLEAGEKIADLAKSGRLREAVDEINRVLEPSPEALQAFAQDFDGMLATIRDQGRRISERIAKPLLNFAVRRMRDLNRWLERNRGQVRAMADAFGNKLVSAAKTVLDLAKALADNWSLITTAVKTLATVWVGSVLIQGMVRLVQLARSFAAVMGISGAGQAIAGGIAAIRGLGAGQFGPRESGGGRFKRIGRGALAATGVGAALFALHEVGQGVAGAVLDDQHRRIFEIGRAHV